MTVVLVAKLAITFGILLLGCILATFTVPDKWGRLVVWVTEAAALGVILSCLCMVWLL